MRPSSLVVGWCLVVGGLVGALVEAVVGDQAGLLAGQLGIPVVGDLGLAERTVPDTHVIDRPVECTSAGGAVADGQIRGVRVDGTAAVGPSDLNAVHVQNHL